MIKNGEWTCDKCLQFKKGKTILGFLDEDTGELAARHREGVRIKPVYNIKTGGYTVNVICRKCTHTQELTVNKPLQIFEREEIKL